jgi:GDP-L-fucose synthase
MRVLITGGAGFVGRHLVKRSLEEGFEVDCVDPIIPLTGGLELDKWLDFDPRDFSAFNFYKVDCREFFQ